MLKHTFEAYLTEDQALGMIKANKSHDIVQELAFTLLSYPSDHLEQVFSNHPDKLKKVIEHLSAYYQRMDNMKNITLEALSHAVLVLDNLELEGKA